MWLATRTAILALALGAPAAHAYTTLGYTWPAGTFPLPWYIAADLGADTDDAAFVTAIQAAFQTWEDAGCGVSFAYQGRASDATFGGTADGKNVVFFLTSTWPEDSALVSTPSIYTENGNELAEVDVALNGQTYAWSTTIADGRALMDVQGSVTHEVGHMLGLWHSTVTGASLNPNMDGNPQAETLEQDDIDGLCSLYSDVATAGSGVLGDTCTDSTDCGDGLFCLADGDSRYCSQDCTATADCGDGYTCEDAGNGDSVCAVAAADAGGCGCATGDRSSAGAGLVVALLALLRRRSRAAEVFAT